MKINKWISAAYIVFATISCVIGCLMLQPQGSAFFLRHMATVGVGVGAATGCLRCNRNVRAGALRNRNVDYRSRASLGDALLLF